MSDSEESHEEMLEDPNSQSQDHDEREGEEKEEEEEEGEGVEEEEEEEIEEEEEEEEESRSPLPSNNIHISNEYMELDEPEILDEKKKMLEEFERKRRARMITVPTDDIEVQQILRQRGEPICLFGEGPADRRNRLKDFLSRLEDSQRKADARQDHEDEDTSRDSSIMDVRSQKEDTWYHRGPNSLKEARMYIVNYSVPRARARLKREKLEKDISDATRKAKKQELQTKLRSFSLIGSQNADSRPVSYCSFSPNGEMLATSSWSARAKLWEISDCSEKLCLRGHSTYIDCIEWHPGSMISIDSSSVNLASSSRDGMVYLWNLTSSDPLKVLPKFEGRVSRVKFHPSGRFLGACVHDNSWRLWDLHMEEEVLFQEGHSKPVYCIAFQKDGSLSATGGLDAFGRVWDLRTGRCIMFMSGHNDPILSIDWSYDGYHLVTGSEDNTARIWDVRARKCIYTIPAHSSLISGVKYDPNAGQYLVTCSYDGSVKLWCHGSFQLLKSLEGHGEKVMSCDINLRGNCVATCSFDRTFKLWGPD
ncbi:UNVERIFIED_CONTAM: hypothetical protein RMT77_004938 [Armadillidium vulgare]